jgi:hypothetical protein
MAGVEVEVSGTGADQLRLRAAPGTTGETLATLADGTSLTVLEGPQAADGYEWWKVRTQDGKEGWVADNWIVLVAP